MLLTFQLSVGMVKMMHFHSFLDSCVELVRTTETGAILKHLGLFDLGKRKQFYVAFISQVLFFRFDEPSCVV